MGMSPLDIEERMVGEALDQSSLSCLDFPLIYGTDSPQIGTISPQNEIVFCRETGSH